MISYSAGVMPQELISAFERTVTFVQALPGADMLLNPLRCHEVTRVVSRLLNGPDCDPNREVIDGVYGSVDHSWIVFPGHPYVLDPYAVGRLPQVQLLAVDLGLGVLYEERSVRTDIDIKLIEMLVRAHGCEHCDSQGFIHHQHPLKPLGVIMNTTLCHVCGVE